MEWLCAGLIRVSLFNHDDSTGDNVCTTVEISGGGKRVDVGARDQGRVEEDCL